MKNKRLITVVVIILVYLAGAFIYGKASGEKESTSTNQTKKTTEQASHNESTASTI